MPQGLGNTAMNKTQSLPREAYIPMGPFRQGNVPAEAEPTSLLEGESTCRDLPT